MKKMLVLISILLLIQLMAINVWAQVTEGANTDTTQIEQTQPHELDALVLTGDELFKKWDHQGALDIYLEANEKYPNTYDVTWRIARQYTELGQAIPDQEKDAKEQTYEKAMEFAQKAVELDSMGVDGHLRVAIVAGRLGLFKGGKELINLSRTVNEHADKAVELDPDGHVGHYLLARWNRKIANLGFMKKTIVKIVYGGFPPASNETAVEEFKKTIELDPGFIEAHLELGRTYAERMNKYAEARVEFQTVLDLPVREEEDQIFKAEAAELLKKYQDKN